MNGTAASGGLAIPGSPQARGEWLAFLDDDDLWSPHKLRRQLDASQAKKAVFGYTAAVVLDEEGVMIDSLEAPPPEQLLSRLLPGNAIPAGASNVLARTDVVSRLGGFDESLAHLADWDMWLRLAHGGRCGRLPRAAARLRASSSRHASH